MAYTSKHNWRDRPEETAVFFSQYRLDDEGYEMQVLDCFKPFANACKKQGEW